MRYLLLCIGVLFIGSCQQSVDKKEDKELNELLDRIQNDNDTNAIKELLEKADNSNDFTSSTLKDIDSAHFKIVFPCAKIQEKTLRMKDENGRFNVYQLNANRQNKNDDNLAYSVNYHFLDKTKDQKIIDAFYDRQRGDLLSRINGKLESERIIELNGVEGREIYISLEHMSAKMTVNFFYKEGVFYNIAVLTSNENLFNKKLRKFLNSFEFI